MTGDREEISRLYQRLQDSICGSLESLDGRSVFREDHWQRPGGGGGRSRIIEDGKLIAKGGVNFSAVEGEAPAHLKEFLGRQDADRFFATGLSIVLHPQNPWVPIIHMNVRYFEIDERTWWFGGGIDLTPHYIFNEDASWFHRQLKVVCDKYDEGYYPKFKKWADDYFFLSHRNETRGVGGVFFDRLHSSDGKGKEAIRDFTADLAGAFVPIYSELADRRKSLPFDASNQRWQNLRRGRYVEFNLIYDRGTRFGLETSGRVESILMSLPPLAEWAYDLKPAAATDEAITLSKLVKGINWVAVEATT